MEITTLTHCPHSQKVSEISDLLAVYAGLPPDTAELIRQAALYHDIGKSSIDPAILNKPGRLTEEEYAVVKTHTRLGTQEITQALRILTVARTIAAQHHEKIDGNGYLGLCGDEIHPFSRIVAVADVYDVFPISLCPIISSTWGFVNFNQKGLWRWCEGCERVKTSNLISLPICDILSIK